MIRGKHERPYTEPLVGLIDAIQATKETLNYSPATGKYAGNCHVNQGGSPEYQAKGC